MCSKQRRWSRLLLSGGLVAISAVTMVGQPSASASVDTKAHPPTVLYRQMHGDTGRNLVSEHWYPYLHSLNARGVDDFVVPAEGWTLTRVVVAGAFRTVDQFISSVNVTVYADDQGAPGSVVKMERSVGAKFKSSHPGRWDGVLAMQLPKAMSLPAGTYWISVRVNKASFGLWGWETTSELTGNGALWKNRLDGFHLDCKAYTPLQQCNAKAGPDFMFSLHGYDGS